MNELPMCENLASYPDLIRSILGFLFTGKFAIVFGQC